MPNNNLPALPPGYELDSPTESPSLPEGYSLDRAGQWLKVRGSDARLYSVHPQSLEQVKAVDKGARVVPNEPKDSKSRFQKAHADLKKLLSEHAEHLSGQTLGVFLDTLNRLKKGSSEDS
jgi:hypothetical protein